MSPEKKEKTHKIYINIFKMLPQLQTGLLVGWPGTPEFNFNHPANNMDFCSRLSSCGS